MTSSSRWWQSDTYVEVLRTDSPAEVALPQVWLGVHQVGVGVGEHTPQQPYHTLPLHHLIHLHNISQRDIQCGENYAVRPFNFQKECISVVTG